jgi:hypothetical protein
MESTLIKELKKWYRRGMDEIVGCEGGRGNVDV